MRLNLEITSKEAGELRKLKSILDLSSIADVVRRAIKLLTLFIRLQNSGGKILLRKKDGTEETIIIL